MSNHPPCAALYSYDLVCRLERKNISLKEAVSDIFSAFSELASSKPKAQIPPTPWDISATTGMRGYAEVGENNLEVWADDRKQMYLIHAEISKCEEGNQHINEYKIVRADWGYYGLVGHVYDATTRGWIGGWYTNTWGVDRHTTQIELFGANGVSVGTTDCGTSFSKQMLTRALIADDFALMVNNQEVAHIWPEGQHARAALHAEIIANTAPVDERVLIACLLYLKEVRFFEQLQHTHLPRLY